MQEDDDQVESERGPLGDARPDAQEDDPRANPGQPQERVEDRPSVSRVTPEDYPADARATVRPD